MLNHSFFSRLKKLAFIVPMRVLFEDSKGNKIKVFSFYIKSLILAAIFNEKIGTQRSVGLCLPNTCDFPLSFFALMYNNYLTTIIDYNAEIQVIKDALQATNVSVIITSRVFVEETGFYKTLDKLTTDNIQVIYLEDFLNKISNLKNLFLLAKRFFSKKTIADDELPAIILPSSGSEDCLKWVALSQENLIINALQLIDSDKKLTHHDVIFSSLPFYHAFGLLLGIILPVVYGIKSFIYPTPLDYKEIPKFVKLSRASIFFSTNTYLKRYAENITDNEIFNSVRSIYAGAEKLYREVIDIYWNLYKVRVYQGYGLTEASPIVSFNSFGSDEPRSVGKPLSGIKVRLDAIDGYANGGRLFIKGPNLMLGYYRSLSPNELIGLVDGWHDTGDIAYQDKDGFLYILGRASRFIKIENEVISLENIEIVLYNKWPHNDFAAICKCDENNTHTIILYTNLGSLDNELLFRTINGVGLSKTHVPSKIVYIEKMPILSIGKIDYMQLQTMEMI